MQWRQIFGKICGAFYTDSLAVFLGTLCSTYLCYVSCSKWYVAPAEHLGDVPLASDGSYSCCSTSATDGDVPGLEHRYKPCYLGTACVLAGREWTTEEDNGNSP